MQTSFSLSHLILISAAYLFMLFGVAWVSDRGLIPRWIIRHPLTYTLSLGVYASARPSMAPWAWPTSMAMGFSPPISACAAPFCWRRCCSTRSCASLVPISCRRWPTGGLPLPQHGAAR